MTDDGSIDDGSIMPTLAQGRVLALLKRIDPTPPKEIAAYLDLSRSAVHGRLGSAERWGWATKTEGGYIITEEGAKALRALGEFEDRHQNAIIRGAYQAIGVPLPFKPKATPIACGKAPWFETRIDLRNSMNFVEPTYDPYQFSIPSFSASFLLWSDEMEDYDLDPIAYATGYIIDQGNALNAGVDIIEVCDAESQELLDVASAMFDDDREEPEMNSRMIYVDAYQTNGLDIGPALFSLALSFGGADVISFGGSAEFDMGSYGFTHEPMERWSKEYALWWFDLSRVPKDFPIPRSSAKIIRPAPNAWKRGSRRNGIKRS